MFLVSILLEFLLLFELGDQLVFLFGIIIIFLKYLLKSLEVLLVINADRLVGLLGLACLFHFGLHHGIILDLVFRVLFALLRFVGLLLLLEGLVVHLFLDRHFALPPENFVFVELFIQFLLKLDFIVIIEYVFPVENDFCLE